MAMTQAEIDALIAKVKAGTYTITDALKEIAASARGKDVRKALYGLAYTLNQEGKAGSVDLLARERISNLITHNNDTDGNSELQDARVGSDGTIYPSAGDAMRQQNEKRKEEIDELKGDLNSIPFNINWIDGMYIIPKANKNNGLISNANYCYCEIDGISEGDTLCIQSNFRGNVTGYAFFDNEGINVGYFIGESGTGLVKKIVQVPINAVSCRVGGYIADKDKSFVKLKTTINDVLGYRGKVDKNQNPSDFGKVLGIGENGEVTPIEVVKEVTETEVIEALGYTPVDGEKVNDIVDVLTTTETHAFTGLYEAKGYYHIKATCEDVGFYGGKNFLIIPDCNEIVSNGVTFSVNNQTISIKGTATASAWFNFPITEFTTPLSKKYNLKIFYPNGKPDTVINNIYLCKNNNSANACLSFGNFTNHDEMVETSSATYQEAKCINLYVAKDKTIDVEFKLLLTMASKGNAGNYECSTIPTQFTGTIAIKNNKDCYFQSNESIGLEMKKLGYNSDKERTLPSYWSSYIRDKIDDINTKVTTFTSNGVMFNFITDLHLTNNNGYSDLLINEIRKKTAICDLLVGGDTLSYEHTPQNISVLRDFAERYIDDKTFSVVGNHDSMEDIGITKSMYYNLVNRYLEHSVVGELGENYYYLDNKTHKTRFIFLSNADFGYTWGTMSDRQWEWYKSVLSSTEDGWKIIVVQHCLFNGDSEKTGTLAPGYGSDMVQLADKYNNRETGSITARGTDYTVNYDFTSGSAEVICFISGHCHTDYSATISNILCIATTTDCCADSQSYDLLTRDEGTTTENAFDIFMFDYDIRKIKTIRIGAGSDREWNF